MWLISCVLKFDGTISTLLMSNINQLVLGEKSIQFRFSILLMAMQLAVDQDFNFQYNLNTF